MVPKEGLERSPSRSTLLVLRVKSFTPRPPRRITRIQVPNNRRRELRQEDVFAPVVPKEGLEPSRLTAPASKTGVSTIPPSGHTSGDNVVGRVGIEPTKPKQRIYSPPHLTTLEPTHVCSSRERRTLEIFQSLEPPERLELSTVGLQNRCSTN